MKTLHPNENDARAFFAAVAAAAAVFFILKVFQEHLIATNLFCSTMS